MIILPLHSDVGCKDGELLYTFIPTPKTCAPTQFARKPLQPLREVGGFILDPYEVKRRELIRLQIEIEDMIDFSQGIQKLEEELERQRKITKYSVNIQEKIREIEKEIEREESEREREREKGP